MRTLRVAMRGNVIGHVTSQPEGIDCPGACTHAFAAGTAVTLLADPPGDDAAAGKRFVGWDASGCSAADGTCSPALSAPLTLVGARFYQRYNLAFVSSTTSDGMLGGLEGADALCEQLATTAGLPPGPYVAWLSRENPASNAADRLGTGSGWVRVDGKPFALSKIDLLAGRILYPLRLDEHGDDVQASNPRVVAAFTGTNSDGSAAEFDCQGWTAGFCGNDCLRPAILGSPGGGTDRWTRNPNGLNSCGVTAHIYCLGTGLATRPPAPPPPAPPASVIWISSTVFRPGQGATATELCQEDALNSGLLGDSRAIFAGLGAGPIFWLGLVPGTILPMHFVRPDGVVPVDSLTDLLDGGGFRAAINVAPGPGGSLEYVGSNARGWLGSADMNVPATDTVCDGLTTGDFSKSTLVVDPALAHIQSEGHSCNEAQRVWCTEFRAEPLP